MAANSGGVFDSAVKAWLRAMQKASRIKPGGRLMFINKRTGNIVPASQTLPSAPNLESGAAGGMVRSVDPVAELRQRGMVLGKPKRARKVR